MITPSGRGWYAVALFLQTTAILAMIPMFPELSKDEFFKTIANAIIVTGWIGFAVGLKGNSEHNEQVSKLIDVAKTAQQSGPGAAGQPDNAQPPTTLELTPEMETKP